MSKDNPYIGSDDAKATERVIKRKDSKDFEHEGGLYDGRWVKRPGRRTRARMARRKSSKR